MVGSPNEDFPGSMATSRCTGARGTGNCKKCFDNAGSVLETADDKAVQAAASTVKNATVKKEEMPTELGL
jgi:hypothetical protein